LEVGGMNVGGESDQLWVTGDAMIDGTVVFKFIDGFAPTAGQEFGTLLAVDGAVNVGEASFVVQNLANGFEYDVTPMGSGFMLTALTDGTFQQAVPGDYNNSGQVEQADLDLVLLNWGNAAMPIPDGWINDLPAGLIDQAELDGVLLNWGNALAGATSVPEPSTAALLALALVAAATSFGVRHAK
jgi:hypothetical protein